MTTWRNHSDHKAETKAVKAALATAGIKAAVKHGTGTAWAWLEINLGPPGPRGGFILDGNGFRQSTPEEADLRRRALQIAQEVTGRSGDYDGEINILTQ